MKAQWVSQDLSHHLSTAWWLRNVDPIWTHSTAFQDFGFQNWPDVPHTIPRRLQKGRGRAHFVPTVTHYCRCHWGMRPRKCQSKWYLTDAITRFSSDSVNPAFLLRPTFMQRVSLLEGACAPTRTPGRAGGWYGAVTPDFTRKPPRTTSRAAPGLGHPETAFPTSCQGCWFSSRTFLRAARVWWEMEDSGMFSPTPNPTAQQSALHSKPSQAPTVSSCGGRSLLRAFVLGIKWDKPFFETCNSASSEGTKLHEGLRCPRTRKQGTGMIRVTLQWAGGMVCSLIAPSQRVCCLLRSICRNAFIKDIAGNLGAFEIYADISTTALLFLG